MVLRRDAPIEVDLDSLSWGPSDTGELKRLFDFLEFRTLFERLEEVLERPSRCRTGGRRAGAGGRGRAAATRRAAAGLLRRPDAARRGGGVDRGAGSFSAGRPGRRDRRRGGGGGVAAGGATSTTRRCSVALTDGRPVRAHQAKALIRGLAVHGIDLRSLAARHGDRARTCIDPAENRYDVGDLLDRYTGDSLPVDGVPDGQLDLGGEATDDAVATAREALAVSRLAPALVAALDKQGMRAALRRHREPARRACWPTWRRSGIGVDAVELRRLNDRLTSECQRLAAEVYAAAGREFNLNSPLQMRQMLFDERGLSPQKRTKTGFSTDAASLEKLRDQWPELIDPLLSYREVEKLRSTYGEGLLAEVAARRPDPRHVQPDGRPHRPAVSRTSRTSTTSRSAPRKGASSVASFVPAPGHLLLVADYNQIELRCIAHLAEDPGPHRRVHRTRRTSTPPRRRGSSASTRRRSRSPSGRRRRWCRTGWPTAWRPTGWGSG